MHERGTTTGSARLRRSAGGSLLLVIAAAACDDGSGAPPTREHPYRFEATAVLGPVPFFEDLDGDARDEIVQVFQRPGLRSGRRTSVLIRSHDDADVHRLDYVGSVGRPHALDLDEDGTREIFVPFVRDDTLHLSVADTDGNQLLRFPLVVGRPRIEPEGELPWDPTVLSLHLVDLTGNGRRELVSVISTGFARDPRGIFVHALPGGRLLDSLTVGARLDHASLQELRNGGPVLVLAARATHNGAVAGGFDDVHSYAMAVDLRLPLRIRWSRELGGVGSRAWISPIDLVGNRDADLLVVAGDENEGRVALMSSAAGVTLLSRHLPGLSHPVVTDLEGDGRPEIVAIEGGSRLVALSPELKVEERVALPMQLGYLREWPDLDGDGKRELSAFDVSKSRHVLLSRDLRVKAVVPGGSVRSARELDVFRRGPTRTPLLVTAAGDGYGGFELSRDRTYLVRRFGPPAAAAVVPLLFLLLAAAWFRARRRYQASRRAARALRARAAAASEKPSPRRPLLRVEPGGQVDPRGPPPRREDSQEGDPSERRRRPA